MSGDHIAVIDLGSNTFHLLICEINADDSWTVIHKERIYVKLASGGLDTIDDACIQRGLDAMERFASQIKSFNVVNTKAIGTAALREAKNGSAIAEKFSLATGLDIEIIDGHREAGYILRGIKSVIPPLDRHGLIMDIGGGSVEFIFFRGDDLVFTASYKIGVAVLYRMFHHSDPIHPDEIKKLEHFLDEELGGLIEAVKEIPEYYLIGASGSFEVIQDVLPKISASGSWSELAINDLSTYLDEIIGTKMNARRQIPEIPIERLDYIVVAYILIRYIFHCIPPKRLFYCDYALKEGILTEMVEILNLD